MKLLRHTLLTVQSAYKSVRSIPWKSNIIILTILFGSMGIAATFSISQNIDGYIEFLMDKNGGAKVDMQSFAPGQAFNEASINKFKNISVVKKVYSSDVKGLVARKGSKSSLVMFSPVTVDNWRELPVKIRIGEWISPLQGSRNAGVVVLSSIAAKRLGGDSILGQIITLKSKIIGDAYFKVIGIVDMAGINPDLGQGYISWPLYKTLTGAKSLNTLTVIGYASDWMNWIESFGVEAFKKQLDGNISVDNSYSAYMEQRKQLGAFLNMGYFLGLLALLAGSIGSTSLTILNIGLRKREIGLYKAMGFSRTIILIQFTSETLILSFIGGILGGLGGTILGFFMSKSMFGFSSWSAGGLFIGLFTALFVGLIFGLIPAVIAARLDPVKALQG